MSWMQSAPDGHRSLEMASSEREGITGSGLLAQKGTAAWLPVKRLARTVQSHYRKWLWVLCWSVFSLCILSSMSSQAMETRREALAEMCDERARMLEEKVDVTKNQLHALAILVSTFHHSKSPSAIDQETFARYLELTAFERPRTTGLAYAVRVRHAEREQFERQQAWSIKAMMRSSKSNRMVNLSTAAEEYAPVIFAQDAYEHIVSFDMLSGNEDRENVLRARESGKGVLTAPFKLLNNRIGVILTLAVYKSELPPNSTAEYRIQSAIGYLGCLFDIEAQVDELLHKLAGEQSIKVSVYDTTSERPIGMYGRNGTGSDGMCHVSMLNFGDPSRKHEMHCRFRERQPWPWLAITSSYGTLVVSLLVGYIFDITGKRIANVQGPDASQATHEPFQSEQLYTKNALVLPSPLELEHNLGLEVPEQEVEEELNLREDAMDKMSETETNLVEMGTRSKFITKFKELTSLLSSQFRYINKKVASVILFGLVLYFIVIGAFDRPFNQSLGMRSRGDDNMMLKKFGSSHGRLLITTLHDKWAQRGVQGTDMIRVDLRRVTGKNDSSVQHWSSHNSSEIPATLYVLMNGKQVRIHCNLIADQKALANWISNGNTDLSSKSLEDTTEVQNRTVRPDLPAHKSHITTLRPWFALISATVLLVLGIAVWVLLSCKRRTIVQQKEVELLGGMGLGPRGFLLHELAAATSNFAVENKLGQGGFGPVYRGYLRDQDLHVAIKVLSEKQSSQEQSEQGLREFKAEVQVMTQLRHRNIVKLVGWCDKKRLLLVYELMAQGSLDKHLYDPEKTLTWQQRFKIVLDLGSALLYLHRDCEKCIVHGDIKPANLMLDVSHNAKLGDFGLARHVEHGGEPQTTQVVAGTPGYIDPEFINNRWPRTELDVYSFGVVLLEIACGKRPASRQPNGASSLLAWVHGLYDQSMVLDAADERLNGQFDQRQMERVIVTGLWCAHQDPIRRPSIVQAMDVLRSADAELPVLPAGHDARHIRSMEEQAYADLPVEDRSVSCQYFTSKDSVYLLAEE